MNDAIPAPGSSEELVYAELSGLLEDICGILECQRSMQSQQDAWRKSLLLQVRVDATVLINRLHLSSSHFP